MVDPESNYGTLIWEGEIATPVNQRPADLRVSVYILPNVGHHDYMALRSKQEEDLESALNKGAYGRQGLFIYRNMRLIDAAGAYPWKGVYSEVDNQRTHLRWEVHLPPGRDVGAQGHQSEFTVNKSKRDVGLSPRIVKELKRLARDRSKQRWHELDPEYPIGMAARAKLRLNKDKGDKSDAERFGSCSICHNYMHKAADHRCSMCGQKGKEATCCQPHCRLCGRWGHDNAMHQCTICGKTGHEGGCNEGGSDGRKRGGSSGGSGPDPVTEPVDEGPFVNLAVNSTTSGDPIQINIEDSTFKVSINRNHELFQELIDGLKMLGPEGETEEGD